MDPNTAVATSPLVALLAFLGVIVLLLFLIAKWRWACVSRVAGSVTVVRDRTRRAAK